MKMAGLAFCAVSAAACLTVGCGDHRPAATGGSKPVPVVTGPAKLAGRFSRGPFGLAKSAWPKAHGDMRNSGQGAGAGARGKIKWRIPFAFFGSSPAIGEDGTVYVGSKDGYLYALDSSTGAGRWRVRIGSDVCSSPAISARGIVYIEGGYFDGGDAVYAIDGVTGGLVWSTFARTSGQSPAITPDGRVLIGTMDGLEAMDAGTGAVKWMARIYDGVTATPAIAQDGTLVVGSDSYLYGIDGVGGRQKWKARTNGMIVASPAMAPDGTVIQGTVFEGAGSDLYAFDGRTGRVKWSRRVESNILPLGVDTTPAIGRDGAIYVAQGRRLYALNGSTGAIKWQRDVGGDVKRNSPIAGGDGVVYAVAGNGDLTAVDGAAGSIKWRVRLGKTSDTSPALGADGTIYIGSNADEFYAVR